jgi:phosphomannomutase
VRFDANDPRGNTNAIVANEAVQATVKQAENIMVKIGRVLLRKLGAEPLIRVMIKAECRTMAQTQAEVIAKAVQHIECQSISFRIF